ncbi:hypothetical protein [Streptomyces sp. NPDC018031]|uniref:hypothetical protein n=1 Tax=Streptomyces sp. NPDC018031 TaxID=3365033 RepID=UPI003788EE4F
MTPGAGTDTDGTEAELAEIRAMLSEGLAEAGGGHRALLRLTDEELAVIDPGATEGALVPSPHLANLSETERELVVATALRSLVSRELIEVDDIDELEELMRRQEAEQAAAGEGASLRQRTPVSIRMADEAALVLNLRRHAERLLSVELATSGGASHACVYVHAADLFLVERVTSGGLHLFTLTNDREAAAGLIQASVDPFGVAAKDGSPLPLDPHALDRDSVPAPLRRVIDDALVVGRLMLLADEPGPLVTTYATERELWSVVVEAPQSPEGIVARAHGTRSLGALISRLLELPQ